MEKIDNDKTYPELISVEMIYDEIYLNLHHHSTPKEVIEKTSSENTQSCFALTPEAALELSSSLVNAAYYSKVKKREKKQKKY